MLFIIWLFFVANAAEFCYWFGELAAPACWYLLCLFVLNNVIARIWHYSAYVVILADLILMELSWVLLSKRKNLILALLIVLV